MLSSDAASAIFIIRVQVNQKKEQHNHEVLSEITKVFRLNPWTTATETKKKNNDMDPYVFVLPPHGKKMFPPFIGPE